MEKMDGFLENIADFSLKDRVRIIIDQINDENSRAILDCGCGDGLYILAAREILNKKVFGLDIDKNNIKKIKERFGNDVDLVIADIDMIPFKRETFDKIICSEVIEHVRDDKEAVLELQEILKKNGHLMLTVPNRNYPFFWDPVNKFFETFFSLHFRSGFFSGIWGGGHRRLYSIDHLERITSGTNLEKVKTSMVTHFCFPFNHNILYTMRYFMDNKLISSEMTSSMDKMNVEEKDENETSPIKKLFGMLNEFSKKNIDLPTSASSVSIFMMFKKVG